MSDLRVALVAEGPIDAIVIEAALKALLPRPFVLTPLQPESTEPKLGGGWGGVARWCDQFAGRGFARFEDDPTLLGFDLFVVHVDADVAEMRYADYGLEFANRSVARGWPTLPNNLPCPPPTGSADVMRACLLSWAGMQSVGPRTVFCIPSKAPEAWLVAASFNQGHHLLNNLECNLNLEAQLRTQPEADRVSKTTREYRARSQGITAAWGTVRQRCTQAERFSGEVLAVAL
jgi:hypothetical protein